MAIEGHGHGIWVGWSVSLCSSISVCLFLKLIIDESVIGRSEQINFRRCMVNNSFAAGAVSWDSSKDHHKYSLQGERQIQIGRQTGAGRQRDTDRHRQLGRQVESATQTGKTLAIHCFVLDNVFTKTSSSQAESVRQRSIQLSFLPGSKKTSWMSCSHCPTDADCPHLAMIGGWTAGRVCLSWHAKFSSVMLSGAALYECCATDE